MLPFYVGIESFAGKQIPEFSGLDAHNCGSVLIIPAPSTEAMRSLQHVLPGGIDLVLCDGCHCMDCVSYEWTTYGALVAPGGYFIFHDICHREETLTDPAATHRGARYGCRVVWEKVKRTEGWGIAREVHDHNGLGVLQRLGRSDGDSGA
jgi:hypothetical protein